MGDRPWQPHEQAYCSSGTIQASSSLHGNIMRKDSGGYDMADLDRALFLYYDGQDQASSAQEQPETLNIFPSQPMHVEPSPKGSMTLVSNTHPKEPFNHTGEMPLVVVKDSTKATKVKKEESSGKGTSTPSSSEHEGPKTPDPKTLRRLAQNREAARKSRLRKKAYIQQLESSRIRLSQLEQELHRARTQGVILGGGALLADQGSGLPAGIGGLSPDAAMFDAEYGRWQEEHHKMMCQLRAAVEEQLPDGQLRLFVESAAAHYGELMGLKAAVAKSDVFHLVSGIWKTPAERCFLWIGGFRPSELIKVVVRHIEPLTQQQIVGICGLQQSTKETEEALDQALDALHHSLSDTISSDALICPSDMARFMGHMSIAITKLTSLEGFVRQADNLRLHTLHRLPQILTTRQSARCFLAIAEYFHRLRALSSLWIARPRQDQGL